MFNCTRSNIRWHLALRRAHRLCDDCPDFMDALLALSFLNPVARDENNDYRFTIYRLKAHLIRVLYQAGLAESVSLKIQRLVCRACHGRGDFCSGICHRCWGSGTWREIKLYEFVFRFNGRTFTWHQPEELITYPITLTTSTLGTYRSASYALLNHPKQEMLIHIAVLYLYLVSAGVQPTELPAMSISLRACFQLDMQVLRNSLKYRAARIFSLCEFCHRPEFVLGCEVGNHSRCYPF